MNSPHACLTKCDGSFCPTCNSDHGVYSGHGGDTLYCTTCVISWQIGEMPQSVLRFGEASPELNGETFVEMSNEKLAEFFDETMLNTLNNARLGLRLAAGSGDRWAAVRGITDDEWENAQTTEI